MRFDLGGYKLEDAQMSLIKLMELKAKNMGEGVVSLSQGIPWYDMPDELKKSLCEYTKFTKAKDYTLGQGIPELRKKMVDLYGPKYSSKFREDEILISAGAIEAISALLLTIVTKKTDEIIMLEPTYASYSNIIRISGAKKISCPLNDDFSINIEKLKDSINENTQAIVLVNPNNPTGTFVNLKQVKEVLEYIKDKNVYLVTDEVYNHFIFESKRTKCFSHLRLYDKYKKNLVIINSWSKSFGITGWRVGYMIANKFLIKEVLKVHDSLVTCAPSHSQYAIMQNLEILFDFASGIRGELKKRRDYTVKKLNEMSDYIEFEIPTGSYYIFPKFKYTKADYRECMKILEKAKLSLVPGGSFGVGGKGHFRICYGRDMYSLKEGLKRLKKYFESL